MEPVEINAGAYYLRQLRADRHLDDRPALMEAFADPEHRRYVLNYRLRTTDEATEYITLRAAQWACDERCSWAVAEPTTGRLLGEVGLRDLDTTFGTAEASVWTHPAERGGGIAVTALSAAIRFGFGALELNEIAYRHLESNTASAIVAERCGFSRVGLEDRPSPTGEPLVRWVRTS
ncbi:GNAT family N-acetyltransferase [Amycolatopsis jiangsuensis]|uniref:RimJ/RimL family protein N-acetyltransferase n=1 Tax=Amycolatopsis jiangsuensis TaxID=1181879 RepID=A0A840IZB4_9PSEU|nr:GNAT family N-acetyltransferase [Amycolatopsis jiangsuensis]MBB4686204.1 RimJ/RimL family protein N-acetyltransferase [Amycolatopsis jiangsuensis]